MNKTRKILLIFAIILIAIFLFSYKVNAATNYVTTAYISQVSSNNHTTVEITAVCNSNWNANTRQAIEISIIPTGTQASPAWIRIGSGANGEALNKKYTYNVFEKCTVYVRYVYWWTNSQNTNPIEFYRTSVVVDKIGGGTSTIGQVQNVRPSINGQKLVVYWDSVTGADGYEVRFVQKSANIDWTYDCKDAYISFPAFPINNGYSVNIKAYKNVNGSKQYGQSSSTVYFDIKGSGTVTSLTKVTNVKTVVNNKSLSVTWDKVTDANGYDVVFTIPGSSSNWVYDKDTNSVYFKSFPVANGYTVKVRAYKNVNGSKQYGEYSEAVKFDIKETSQEAVSLSQVTNLKTVVNNKSLTVTWDKVNNATGYEVVFAVPGASSNWVYEKDTNQVYFKSFPIANGYTVKVRAYRTVNGSKQYGNYSNSVNFDIKEETVALEQVTYVRAFSHEQHLVLFWNSVQNADGYEINFTANGTTINWNYDADDSVLFFKKFPIQEGYNVKIRAYKLVNGTRQLGAYSDVVTFNIR